MEFYKIKKHLSKNIALREDARVLFKFLLENKYEVLDFEDVEFVSRSFANEFSKLEKNNNILYEKINMNHPVKSMFKYALEETPKKTNTDFNRGNVESILSSI